MSVYDTTLPAEETLTTSILKGPTTAIYEGPTAVITLATGEVEAPSQAPEITRLRRMYDAFRDATQDNAKKQLKDRSYYDGSGQLAEARGVLIARGQPLIYTNRIRPAVDGTLGLLATSQTDPRAFPRNPTDDNAADVASKTLRYISEVNRFSEIKLDCAEEQQIEGLCAAVIEVGGDGTDIIVTQLPWKDFFYDPRSRRHDFKDALYLGTAKWMYADDVARLYPEQYAAMGDPTSGIGSIMDEMRDDKPVEVSGWCDPKLRRLLVVEVYMQEGGEWFRCVYCAAGVFEYDRSPYVDDKGRGCCPIEATSCYIDRDLNRYGRVRDMVPIQDEINSRRSRLLHLSNMRQVQEVSLGAGNGTSADIVRAEAGKADGVIPTGWQMVPTADLAAGQQLLLAESKSEIERMGPTPAVLGRQGNEGQSGRARLVLQQAGMTELARALGRLEDWETRVYRQQWWRAKQYWTEPMWVRVTDDVRAPTFIQLNAPEGQTGEDGQPVPANRIAEMDMDIIVTTVPDTANLQQEVWADLLQLLDKYPAESPQFQIAVEMSPIGDKQRILERIKAFTDEQAQGNAGQAQQAQLAMQAQMEQMKAEIAGLTAKAMLTAAQADLATVQANVAQTQALAEYGPIAGAFGIIPDEIVVQQAMDRARPENAPVNDHVQGFEQAPPQMAPEQGQPEQPQPEEVPV